MNRAARRRKEREATKAPTYNINNRQLKETIKCEIDKEVDLLTKEATTEAITAYTALIIKALNVEFGFGKIRLQRLLNGINNQIDDLNNGSLDIESVIKWCQDYGVIF